jgi:hypothetical protein
LKFLRPLPCGTKPPAREGQHCSVLTKGFRTELSEQLCLGQHCRQAVSRCRVILWPWTGKPLALTTASTRYVINHFLWTMKSSRRSEELLMSGHYGHLRYPLIVSRSWKAITSQIIIQGHLQNLTLCRDFLEFGYNLSEHLAVLGAPSPMPGNLKGLTNFMQMLAVVLPTEKR